MVSAAIKDEKAESVYETHDEFEEPISEIGRTSDSGVEIAERREIVRMKWKLQKKTFLRDPGEKTIHRELIYDAGFEGGSCTVKCCNCTCHRPDPSDLDEEGGKTGLIEVFNKNLGQLLM